MNFLVRPLFVAATAGILFGPAAAEAACTVGPASDASFGSATSFAARATSFQTSTPDAGLNCSGAVLNVLRSEDHVYATLHTANGGLRGPGGDIIPYGAYGDSTTNHPIPFNVQYDYASTQLLNLLGLFSGPSTSLPMFFRTGTGANVAAGVYTDTITVQWAWDYCTGVGLLGVCLGRDQGSGTSTIQVTMTVTNACEVSSAPDVSLGQAPTASSFMQVGQSVTVLCTKDLAAYTVGLSAGQHAASGRRRMAGGGQALQYDVFKPGGSMVWGDAGAARVANGAPANGLVPQVFDYVVAVYPDQSTPPVGVYSDVVIVDVAF